GTGNGWKAVAALAATALIAGVWWTGRPAAHSREPDGKAAMDALKLELRLDKDRYRTDEPVEATVVFRNTGTAELKVPVVDGPEMLLFFDFLLVGDRGTQYLTRHGEGWNDPSEKQVKLVRLPAGGTHTVKLSNVLPWRNTDAGVREDEQY